MKPNIFVYKNLKNEDYFTSTLSYILNLFPKVLGDRFISKLATSAGKSANYFGKFEKAEFTAHDLQNENSTSKPDLVIHTDKTKIFFEIKLTAPLSSLQLERHLNDVKKAKGTLVLVSNAKTKVSKEVLEEKNYLKPLNNDHFLWTDFEPIFDYKFKKNSRDDLLLNDFRQNLRLNEIKKRQILDADDSLYVGGSKSQTLALNELGGILEDIGFKVWRLPQDHTIRVYPKKMKQRPLINPRFYSTGEWLSSELIEECLIICCYANVKDKSQVELLQKLISLDVSFPKIRMYGGKIEKDYRCYIYLPLQFLSAGDSFDLDWKFLRKVWQKIYDILAT